MALARMLAHRRWWRRAEPFPHVVARDVFTDAAYRRLAEEFEAMLARGMASAPAPGRFARSIAGYDALALHFGVDHRGPLSLFFSRPWCELLARVAGVEVTDDVNAGLHHHDPGSQSGTPHNDLNPGWFIERRRPDGINMMDHAACNYYHGATREPGARPRERVRAVAMIYYLANPPWRDGDGGETGLYRTGRDPVDRPTVAVPPINNSLVLFECTPWSFHAFLSNRRHPRNSVIQWLHRPREAAVARWGEERIVHWK
jgi:hypothetical protein